VFIEQGDHASAAAELKQIVDNCEASLGREHPYTILFTGNYAKALQDSGKVKDSLPIFASVLERRTRLLGESSRDTLITMNNYAMALSGDNQFDESVKLATKALELRTQTLGERHNDTVVSINTLARVLAAAGKPAEAWPHYERRHHSAQERHPRRRPLQRRILPD
jgi:tetratricopeptide (TPR) repeat protein